MLVTRIQKLDIEILSCPFCNNTEKASGFAFESIPNEVNLRCTWCQAQGPAGLNDYEAVEFWNDRNRTQPKSISHT